MARGSICEPVEVHPLALVRAERVMAAAADPAPERFAHFHDAAELVWFEDIAGELVSEDGVFPLSAGTLVFVPSMRHHDFAITAGPHRWVLAHLDPALAAGEAQMRLGRCTAVTFAGAMRGRMDALFGWLLELAAEPAPARVIMAGLVELILDSLALAADGSPAPAPGESCGLDRLRPALDLVARNPASAITLSSAASACHLSEAYFSRRFKLVFGTTFSDYLRAYRLRLAAQRLLSGGERVSEIAYQTGFASPAHLADQFRRRFGMSPRDYRAAGHKGQDHESN
ncbi:AraC family transcriptional regulator [Novosphingobium sp.]|uniref:helix-turn-helix transcriptional regulator n=1 Tax=Novosphingobium sp. TaxID=1874826 RepID=UPI003BAC2A3A